MTTRTRVDFFSAYAGNNDLITDDCTNSSVDNTQFNANNNENDFNLIKHNHNTDNLNNNDCSGRGSLGAPDGVD